MFESLFRSVLTMSAGASVVILVVLLLRLALRKAPKRFSCILWALVVIRLLCPVLPESGISLMPADGDVTAMLATVVAEQEQPVQSFAPEVSVGEPDLGGHRPVQQAPSTDSPIQQQRPSDNEQHQIPEQPVADELQKPATQLPQLSGWQIGSVVWLAGIWVMALYGVWSLFRLKSRLAVSVALGGGVYLADHIDTPFVMGLFRPKIYLPSYLNPEKAEYIILHEKYHISRFDHVVKLLYFAALCLHWFNPLVWLAFILMGQDMEMSCDEAVMEKLKQDVRSDYAASLLQLSTGRRKIAPTPLAFGEGDPKGRIKNVLNYRKPRFWIVLVAVVVCVAAAVCLLTNPAEMDKEYLNYPGLQWGMSPEEVKSALELTDENIVRDEGAEPGDEYNLSNPPRYLIEAKGLTCFGEKTTLARFIFCDYSLTCQNFALQTVELYYPDEFSADPVNMKKLQKSISRYYGEPVEQIVRYIPGAPGDPELETADVLEGYTYWLSEQNMDAYLTQEQKDALYGLYESANKDNESFITDRELYDLRYQAYYLVSAFCTDRYGPSNGYPDDMKDAGYTNNYVQITANVMQQYDARLQNIENGILPEATEPTELQEPDGLLNYPGLSWGMKYDEVVVALGKSTADFNEMQEEGREGKSYQLDGVAVSEYIDLTMDVTFRFSVAGGLNGVRITLPNEPMAGDEPVALGELRSEFVHNYGPHVHDYGYYPAPGAPGVSEEYYSDVIAWTSAQTLKEAFPEETLDAYRKAYFPDASDRDWDAYITHKRLATVKTTADEAKFLLKQESAGEPVAIAVFDAEEYVTILENVVQEGPDPLLNYPGLRWGMTPDEVKQALQLRDKQIKSESVSEEVTDYTISVTDLECFGEKINLAVFRFSDGTKMGGPYRLYDVKLFYPDQQCANPVDMDKIVAAVTDYYGQPDQEIITRDFEMNATTRPVPEGAYYWHSELDLDAYITEEQKELLYLHSVHKLVDKADGDREFSDKRWKQNWLSQVWVLDDYLGDLVVDRKDGPTDYCVNITTNKTWADEQIFELTARNGFVSYLQHPYLTWGMNPDAVMLNFEYMGWTVDSDELEYGAGLKRTMELSGQDYFGHSVKKLVLEFVGEKETELKLSFVRVVLDRDASATDIWGELKTRYGREPETYWDCSLASGKYTEQVHKPATAVSVWPSFASLKTRYSDGVLDALRSLYESENGAKVSDEDWAKFAENRYLVSMMFGVNGKANPNRETEDTECIVIDYDASELIAYDAKVAKIRQSYDTALLNYPGLDWGMTIEEVKAALGFGDDAITSVEEREINVTTYCVENLDYFGLPTESVVFSFSSLAMFEDVERGLYEVIVHLPDDTDMEKAKQTVTAYYGDPIDSYSCMTEDGYTITQNSEKGNDLWVSEATSGNTFSEAEQEFYCQQLIAFYGSRHDFKKENIIECLRTTPLTQMNLTDDLYGKVYNYDSPDREIVKAVRYNSNVYGKVQFFDHYREQVEHIGMLNYPLLDWGMTPEEVQTILGYSDGDVELTDTDQVRHYTVKGLEYLGLPTEYVQLTFTNTMDSQWGLYAVGVVLPDDTDMEKAKQTVTSYYGDPIDTYESINEFNGKPRTEKSEEGNDLWLSQATVANTFTEEEQEFYWQFWKEQYKGSFELTRENFMESLRTTPLVRMNLTDDYHRKVNGFPADSDIETIKVVFYYSNFYQMERFFAYHADKIG